MPIPIQWVSQKSVGKSPKNASSSRWHSHLLVFFTNAAFLFIISGTAVDWRDVGAVTSVHSQGSCGACWAITAVETIESAVFIATGRLYDLSETEVIVCADECEMCSGGWPQDAFDYVMDNNGIPLESDLKYNGEFLLQLTSAMEGESDTYEYVLEFGWKVS